MNWLNLEIKNLTSHEFLGSEPLDRATWLCLMRFCAQQENSGIIQNCNKWGERKWMQLVGISKEEALRDSMLWEWKDNSIEVWQYPLNQQLATQAKRTAGKLYGKSKDNTSNSKGNSKDKLTGSNKLSNSLAISSAKDEAPNWSLFEECWKDFGCYGTKGKAKEYWKALKPEDHKEIKERIPIYVDYLKRSEYSQKMFQGWINPKERLWETTYENFTKEGQATKNEPETNVDRMAKEWDKEHGGVK